MTTLASLQTRLAAATAALGSGRLDEAESHLAEALKCKADSPEALFYSSVIAQHRGELEHAAELLKRVLKLRPQLAEAHNNLGAIREAQGRPEEALACYRTAVKHGPRRTDSLANLAHCLLALGRHEEAIPAYRRLLAEQPANPQAHENLGCCLDALGRTAEAMACFQSAIALAPMAAGPHGNLAVCLEREGRLEEALAAYGQAIARDPAAPRNHQRMGRLLQNLFRHAEAIACFEARLRLEPEETELLNDLGNSWAALERYGEAEQCYLGLLAADPRHVHARFNLGNVLHATQRPDEALIQYGEALAVQPDYWAAHSHQANALKSLNRHGEAVAAYREARRLDPGPGTLQNLLFLDLYRDHQPPEILEAHRQFDAAYAAPLRATLPYANPADPERPLRIGYVSGDFCRHSVASFMEPILEAHDREQFRIHAYYTRQRIDPVTARIESLVDRFTQAALLSDEELAERIRADGIDLLVDLSGHTDCNRMLLFARKPAPVQVAYLGYPATTGLAAMDYRISHRDVDPAGFEAHYAERLAYVDGSLWCYRPDGGAPAVTALPALKTGQLSFASLNYYLKVTPRVIGLWARILEALPASRLVMTSVPAGSARRDLIDRFAELGVAPERLSLHDNLTPDAFRELFAQIDIALDPFPYNGTTTSCDCLWQGIPLVTLAGTTGVARSGVALLNSLGLGEWVAENEDQYLAMALRLAGDLPALDRLRQGLRSRMQASPLMDAKRCARELEQAYRRMWREWCEDRRGG